MRNMYMLLVVSEACKYQMPLGLGSVLCRLTLHCVYSCADLRCLDVCL